MIDWRRQPSAVQGGGFTSSRDRDHMTAQEFRSKRIIPSLVQLASPPKGARTDAAATEPCSFPSSSDQTRRPAHLVKSTLHSEAALSDILVPVFLCATVIGIGIVVSSWHIWWADVALDASHRGTWHEPTINSLQTLGASLASLALSRLSPVNLRHCAAR